MPDPNTQWTVIERAGQGDLEAREIFARVYLPVVERYMSARWQGTRWADQCADAVQQVFLECLRQDGPLAHVTRSERWGFRGYLYGVARNVARTFERRLAPVAMELPEQSTGDDSGLQRRFDRDFASALLAEALEQHKRQAENLGEVALRRFELLRMRFWNGLPIREIAQRWNVDPALLHRDYARGREEFREALKLVLLHHCGPGGSLKEEDLLELLAAE